jgi:transcription elongation factor GreA
VSEVSEANPNAITAEGLERLRAEVTELETTGRQEGAERIRIAREWGDLKENSEYHDAKNSLALLERRITVLREKLDNAVVVDTAPPDGDVVAFGSRVEVLDETSGRTSEYTLVGSTEADLSAGLLSAESPVARALFGAREGDVVSIPLPRGQRQLRIKRIGVR